MAKNSITDYSKTAASNTDIQSVDIAEGCLPSGINNAIREIMADLAAVNDGTVSLTSPSFAAASITGDLTVDTNTLKVDSTNNRVGIGTSSPLIPIQLNNYGGIDGNANQLIISNNTYYSGGDKAVKSGFSTRIDLTNQDGSIRFLNTSASSSADAAITLAERMRITSGGNIQIGSTNSGVAGSLDVSIGSTSTSGGITLFSPTNGTHSIGFADGTSGTDRYRGYIEYQHSNDALAFATAASERMRIDSSGNVGIGTTSPSTDLHVYGSTPELRVQSTATNNGFIRFINTSGSMSVGMSGSAANQFLLYDRTNSHTAYLYAGGASGSHTWRTNNTERMRIDSSGNVGIGTSTPSQKLDVRGAGARIYLNNANEDIDMNSAADGQLRLDGSGYAGAIALNTAGMNIYTNSSSRGIIFGVNETERMIIDGSGNVLFGNAVSQIEPRNYTSSNQVGAQLTYGTGDGHEFATPTGVFFNNTSAGSTSLAVLSIRRRGSVTGSITNTATTTAYNTASDHRLKENIADLTGAIARVKSLQPKRFNFIADDNVTVDGFIAHEAAMVVPEAVTGEKDAVDEDGNPDYQGIDQSKLVPLLTAALQEAITKIEDLEARVATLEGN